MNKSSIKIKNIGPIVDVKMDINQINVIIGEQSSGKSTILNLICFCQWVEKQCAINIKNQKYFSEESNFLKDIERYYHMTGYFSDPNRFFEYKGEFINITLPLKADNVEISINYGYQYKYNKIIYIPSERNFVATIPNIGKYNETNDSIMYFIYDWNTARQKYKGGAFQSILEKNIDYKFENGNDYILFDNQKILLQDASSGLQSLIPMYVVMDYLLKGIYKEKLALSLEQLEGIKLGNSEEDLFNRLGTRDVNEIYEIMTNKFGNKDNIATDKLLEDITNQYGKSAEALYKMQFLSRQYSFTNLHIEEPEQNLFPSAQRNFIYQLIKDIHESGKEHSVFLTTHSPYILFSLNNCLLGGLISDKIPEDRIPDFESNKSWINPKLVSIWQIENGEIKSLQDKDGILDDNFFNLEMNKTNNEYLNLLNYYDEE